MKPYARAQLIPLKGLQDRRRRLTDEQKREIRERYASGEVSHRDLARLYGVSRALIGVTVNPERAEAQRKRAKLHWKEYSLRYGKARHAEAVRNTRNYKYGLFKETKKEAS